MKTRKFSGELSVPFRGAQRRILTPKFTEVTHKYSTRTVYLCVKMRTSNVTCKIKDWWKYRFWNLFKVKMYFYCYLYAVPLVISDETKSFLTSAPQYVCLGVFLSAGDFWQEKKSDHWIIGPLIKNNIMHKVIPTHSTHFSGYKLYTGFFSIHGPTCTSSLQ